MVHAENATRDIGPTLVSISFSNEINDCSEIREIVNPHWLMFPPVSFAWHFTFGMIILILGIASVSGNAVVIFIFSKIRGLQNPTSVLVVNLTVTDLGMMVTNCPLYFINSMNGKWIFGKQGCQFYGCCGALFGCTSIITLTAIAIDRYVAICKPFLNCGGAMTSKQAKITLFTIWLYSACWATPPLFGMSNYMLEGFLTTCSFDYLDESMVSRAFILSMCFGAYVAPLLIIAACYFSIAKEVHANNKHTDMASSTRKQSKLQTAKISFLIIVFWVVSWTPYAIVALLGISGHANLLTPFASQVAAICAKSAAVYNPIVYAISHPRYKQVLRNKLSFLKCMRHSEKRKLAVALVNTSRSIARPASAPERRVRYSRQSSISVTVSADVHTPFYRSVSG